MADIDQVQIGGTTYNLADEKQKISSSTAKTYLTGVTTAPTATETAYKGVANTNVYATSGTVSATKYRVGEKVR